MFGVPFTRGRSRAPFLRASGLIVASSGLFLLGCASATGGASSRTSRAAYEPSALPIRAHAAVDPAADAEASRARAPSVRARGARAQPSIEAARQGWRAALARVRQAGSFEDPLLDVGLAPLSIGSSQAPLGYEIGISQRLPWFGKRGLERSAAAAEANASKSDLEALRRELALSASILYDQYFVAVRSLEINRQHLELMRSMRDAATAQLRAGRASAQDALQAEAELAHLEHDALVLAAQRDVTVAQMNELLHRPPEFSLPPPIAELPLPRLPNTSHAPGLEADAVAQRSDGQRRTRARPRGSGASRARRARVLPGSQRVELVQLDVGDARNTAG